MQLFTITTSRDDIQVGFAAGDVAVGEPAVDTIAQAIADNGRITGWRYVVGRGDGGLAHVAAHRVALFAAGIVRIEPYDAEHPVAEPPAS